MVGNDVEEDTAAEQAGASVFLVTDCLLNRHGRDISPYRHGGFDQLQAFLKSSAE